MAIYFHFSKTHLFNFDRERDPVFFLPKITSVKHVAMSLHKNVDYWVRTIELKPISNALL